MAALQQMMAQMGGGAGGGPSAGMPPPGFGDGGSSRAATGDDPNAEHKQWTTIYPIYIDAKRPYGKGCRRVKYESSCLFANSLYIAKALATLKVELVHEPNKTHPKDWENPGRVKAKLFDDEWKSIHPQFRTSAYSFSFPSPSSLLTFVFSASRQRKLFSKQSLSWFSPCPAEPRLRFRI